MNEHLEKKIKNLESDVGNAELVNNNKTIQQPTSSLTLPALFNYVS